MSKYKTGIDAAAIYSETDPAGTIINVNDLFCTASGYTRGELISHNHRIIRSGQHPAAFYGTIWGAISTGNRWCGHICNRRKDGVFYWVNCTIIPIWRTGNNGGALIAKYISVSFDVTGYLHVIQTLQWHASYDYLTGLPNRAMLHAHLSKTMASARRHHFQPFALGILDVDNFKLVNDSLGHLIGDRLLIEIARRLRFNLREYDIIARLGGDEFVCVWTDIDIVQGFASTTRAGEVSEKSLAALRSLLGRVFGSPYHIADGVALQSVKGSLGIALYPEHGEDPDTLLKHADQAMYGAKSRGGNCVQVFQYDVNGKGDGTSRC